MSTISLMECVSPASLRTCGSSVSNRAHLEKRRRLQSKSPDKLLRLTPTPKPKVPHIRGVRLSPACVGSPGRTYASAKWPYECNTEDFNGSVTSEELSDEDLDEICGSQEVARMLSHGSQEDLLVVGSKPKLHSMFEVPGPVITPSAKTKIGDPSQLPQNNADPDFDRDSDPEFDRGCPSPGNPPPSPINFTPSLDGFVVGGKKLQCPKRTNIGMSYNARDFNPGFVKYPLFHCQKCEERVLDEEQSQTALQRRQEEYITNRASPYKTIDRHLMMASRLSQRSRPDSQPNILECEHDARSFLEIYMEKKKQKEQRELERKKRESKFKDEQGPEEASAEISASGKKSSFLDTRDSNKQDFSSTDTCGSYFYAVSKASLSLLKQQTKRRNQALRETPDSRQSSLTTTCSDASRQVTLDISDLSSAVTVQEQDSKRYNRPNHVTPSASDYQASVLDRCQVRPCRSDIWPFDLSQDTRTTLNEAESMEKLRPKTTMRNIDVWHNKRLTPYCPLPNLSVHGSVRNVGIQQSVSDLSVALLSTYHVVEADEIKEEEIEDPPDDVAVSKEEEDSTNDITLTTTVIVPPKDKPCSQWVTFNTDHEPVLNNAPVVNEGCDSFLKRLQRTQLYLRDSGTPIPPGQFCYEPVVDKRYNRWKRRRRKRKDIESRRPAIAVESESSDDDNERAMERIIGRMYVEIHGNPPETPNGTSETPRMRNRRRRRELVSKSSIKQEKDGDGDEEGEEDSTELHYDASSEWILSDASDEELNTLRSNDINGDRKDDYGEDDNDDDNGTVTVDCQSDGSQESSNINGTECECAEQQEQKEPTSPQIQQELSLECTQIVSPDYEKFSSPDYQQGIYVECKRTLSIEKQEQWENDENQDERSTLLDNLMTEHRDTPEIEEELRRCFSGRSYCEDIGDEPDEPANRLCSSCTDDMNMPYLDQSREEIMQRVKDSPTDEILNKDWLPDIPRPACPESPQHRHQKFEIVRNEKFPKVQNPKTPDHLSRLRRETSIRLNKRRNSTPKDFHLRTKLEGHAPVKIQPSMDNHNNTKDNITPKTSRQFIDPKSLDDEPKPISRSGASCWSELGYNPQQPKSVGLVSVTGPADKGLKFSSSPFKASLRPVRREAVKKPIKTDLKDFGILKRKVLSLPKITQTSKSQTVPSYKRGNSIVHKVDRPKEKDKKTETEPYRRPKTMPQPQHHEQKNSNNVNLDPRAEFMFRDYYLRSLYNGKPRTGSKSKPISSSTPAKQTITIDRLDLRKKKKEKLKNSDEERSVSNLSFTRAFTFSMFDLPDFYKLYNKRIERKVKG